MSTFAVFSSVLFFHSFNVVHSGRIKRVINGKEVACDSQPQIASLRNSSSGQHLCGATLLSRDFALTAAHCVRSSPDQYVLRLSNLCSQPLQAAVEEIIVHPLYNRALIAHDIALLRVSLPVGGRTSITYSALPTFTIGLSGECTTYGYGYRDRRIKQISDKLLAGQMTIVSLDECRVKLGALVAPTADDGMLCAMGAGVDACEGDSGGPLVCQGAVEAIISYGFDCAVPDRPGVFTSVAAHLDWIRNTTAISH